MVDYKNGRIYKLVCNITGKTYYGSTTRTRLSDRLSEHKSGYRRWKLGQCNKVMSFDIIENDNFDIVLVEEFPCDNKDQLHARERYYIENNECINKYIFGQTNKEYQEKNKEKIKAYLKEYNIKNNERLTQQKREYWVKTKDTRNKARSERIECECGSVIRIGDKAKHSKIKKHLDFIKNK